MFAVQITPQTLKIVAAMNDGVVPEIPPEDRMIAHYFVHTDPEEPDAPAVMDIQEFRDFCARRNVDSNLIHFYMD